MFQRAKRRKCRHPPPEGANAGSLALTLGLYYASRLNRSNANRPADNRPPSPIRGYGLAVLGNSSGSFVAEAGCGSGAGAGA